MNLYYGDWVSDKVTIRDAFASKNNENDGTEIICGW